MPNVAGGLHVVRNPIFVNVYWDPTFDNDMANTGAGPLCSMASIDAFTKAVVESSYFDNLRSYGVSGASFVLVPKRRYIQQHVA